MKFKVKVKENESGYPNILIQRVTEGGKHLPLLT